MRVRFWLHTVVGGLLCGQYLQKGLLYVSSETGCEPQSWLSPLAAPPSVWIAAAVEHTVTFGYTLT